MSCIFIPALSVFDMERTTMEMDITIGNEQEDEAAKLKREIIMQRERNDILCQELHEAKRLESFFINASSDARDQIETLEKELVEARANRKLQLETQRAQKLTRKSEVLSLQQELDQIQLSSSAEIQRLEQNVADLKAKKLTQQNGSQLELKDSDADILMENENLKRDIIENKRVLQEKTDELDKLEKKRVDLLTRLEETRGSLQSAKDDLKTINNDLKELSESTAELEGEVSRLRATQPQTEGTRGNCLFGQVDDKRVAVIEKTRLVTQAYQETLQTVARSSAQLRQLRTDHIATIEGLKKTHVKEEGPDQSLLNKIQELERKYEEAERSLDGVVPCVADPSLHPANQRYVNYIIHTPWEKVKEAKQEMNKCSAKQLEIAEELYRKRMELINVRRALLLEESRQRLVLDQINDYKNSKMLNLGEESCEKTRDEGEKRREAGEKSGSTSGQVRSDPDPSGVRPPDNKPRRPPLKFQCKQTVVNWSDFDD